MLGDGSERRHGPWVTTCRTGDLEDETRDIGEWTADDECDEVVEVACDVESRQPLESVRGQGERRWTREADIARQVLQ